MFKLEYEKLTIYEVESFHKEILDLLKTLKESLVIDFSTVTKIDMTAIQLLVSLHKTCEKRSCNLILKNLSSGMLEKINVAGCSSILRVKND